MWIIGYEHEPADGPAEKIEGKIADAAERPLDVVAEHPQEDHVADEVCDIGMEELVSDEGDESRHPSPRADLADQRRRRQTEGIDQTIERELARPGLVEEDREAGGAPAPGDDPPHPRHERGTVVDQ